MSRVVHVVIGESAAGSFKRSGVAADRNDVLVLPDHLSCGPLLPISDVPSWTRQRIAYWRRLWSEASDEEENLYSNPVGLLSSDAVVIWLGTDLGDQIALAWLPAFLAALDAQDPALKLSQFEHGERGLEIIGLGMLSPKQIAAHPPVVDLTAENLRETTLVWHALTSADPDGLLSYLRSPSGSLPLLVRALREGLTRFPDIVSGLNTWEMRLLSNAQKAREAARVIGQTLADGFDALRARIGGRDQVGDFWLFDRMLRLGDPKLAEPALEITGSRVEYRDTEVRLTPFGQRLLDGKANFVDANGIDDWVFGVHHQSEAGRVWFHRDGNLIRR